MIKTLFFLILLTAAVAMPLWIARCRQRDNRRWLLCPGWALCCPWA